MSPLTIRLFGFFEVWVHDRPVPHWRTRKEKWLVALLTLAQGHPRSRAWLAQTLWPDPLESQAAANLRRSLYQVRLALGPEAARLLIPTPDTVALDLAGAEVDVLAFDRAVSADDTASLGKAVSLYRGPLLEECMESWVLSERDARYQKVRKALETLASRALAAGDDAGAADRLRHALALDPWWEAARRDLMKALARQGDAHAALETYREFSRLLHRDDPRAAPAQETTALYQKLLADTRCHAESRPPTSSSPTGSRVARTREGGEWGDYPPEAQP